MTESTPIVDLWLPHDMATDPDLRFPIQGIRIPIAKKPVATRFPKREECLQDYKGFPRTVYFRRRADGFMISMQ